jgi:hypothetical protein
MMSSSDAPPPSTSTPDVAQLMARIAEMELEAREKNKEMAQKDDMLAKNDADQRLRDAHVRSLNLANRENRIPPIRVAVSSSLATPHEGASYMPATLMKEFTFGVIEDALIPYESNVLRRYLANHSRPEDCGNEAEVVFHIRNVIEDCIHIAGIEDVVHLRQEMPLYAEAKKRSRPDVIVMRTRTNLPIGSIEVKKLERDMSGAFLNSQQILGQAYQYLHSIRVLRCVRRIRHYYKLSTHTHRVAAGHDRCSRSGDQVGTDHSEARCKRTSHDRGRKCLRCAAHE